MSKSNCKCCQESIELLNLWDENCHFGEVVVYGEIINKCFAFSWKKPKTDQEYICRGCIRRLSDAFDFKNEILATKHKLESVLSNNEIAVKPHLSDPASDTEVEVKTEYLDIEYLLEDECVNISDAVFSDDDKSVTVDKKSKLTTEYTQEELEQCLKEIEMNNTSIDDAASMFNIPADVVKDAVVKDAIEKDTLHRQLSAQKRGPPLSDRATRHTEQQYVLKLIQNNSNATPFKQFNGRNYECYFCEKQYEKPADLKRHTLKFHKKSPLKITRIFKDGVKMDVTRLSCQLCHADVELISDFCDHLKSAHYKRFVNSVDNFLIPFKFDSDGFNCAICAESFLYFKLLNEHMKKHFVNYECDKCGAGFTTRSTLIAHRMRHADGEFKCNLCSKVFSNKTRAREHQKQVHLKVKRNKCGYCDEKFHDISKKKQHEHKVHGAKKPAFECQACDRVFQSQKSRLAHVKVYHLMIRHHKCSVCDMGFTTPLALKEHMVKHTRSRDYVCNVCSKGFGRKYTLVEHMRIHANDRRHACGICSQTFIQKCSLKAHMVSKHNIGFS